MSPIRTPLSFCIEVLSKSNKQRPEMSCLLVWFFSIVRCDPTHHCWDWTTTDLRSSLFCQVSQKKWPTSFVFFPSSVQFLSVEVTRESLSVSSFHFYLSIEVTKGSSSLQSIHSISSLLSIIFNRSDPGVKFVTINPFNRSDHGVKFVAINPTQFLSIDVNRAVIVIFFSSIFQSTWPEQSLSSFQSLSINRGRNFGHRRTQNHPQKFKLLHRFLSPTLQLPPSVRQDLRWLYQFQRH
jgi:hypothetical protein